MQRCFGIRGAKTDAGRIEPEGDAGTENEEMAMCVGLSIGSVDEESQRKGDDPHEKDGNGMDVDEIG